MAIGDHIGLPDDVSVGFVIGMYIASCAQTYFTFVLLYFAVFCIVYIMIYIYTYGRIIENVFIFIEHLLKIQLTRVEQFHSHLEPMRLIKKDLFSEQVITTKYI